MEHTYPPEGKRVRFSSLKRENLYTHFAWNNDQELNRLDSETPYREESLGAFKNRFEKMLVRPGMSVRDFEIHTGDRLIGIAYLSAVSRHHSHCSVGVTIGDREYWGKGYGKEAITSLLVHCFETLGMHRVTAEAFSYNGAWRRLVEGMGFTHEGVDRDYLFREDRYHDRHRFGLLASEFRSGRGCRIRRSVGPPETNAA